MRYDNADTCGCKFASELRFYKYTVVIRARGTEPRKRYVKQIVSWGRRSEILDGIACVYVHIRVYIRTTAIEVTRALDKAT